MVGMKLLYLAGPFSADDGDPDPYHAVEENILAASRIALEAARAGWMPVCPHKNTAGFHHATDIPRGHWYRGDIELMARCDAVLMLPGWVDSAGARAEWYVATSRGMPIYEYDRTGMVPAPTRLLQPVMDTDVESAPCGLDDTAACRFCADDCPLADHKKTCRGGC